MWPQLGQMKTLDKVNSGWTQEQIIKLTALYSALHGPFEERITRLCTNRIYYQFLRPDGHGHRSYNIYKKQFAALVQKSASRVLKVARKLRPSGKKRHFDVKDARIVDLVHEDILYNPLEEVEDTRYSIAQMDGAAEEVCLLCKNVFRDIRSHYGAELQHQEEKTTEVEVSGMERFGVDKQVLRIRTLPGAKVGDLKRSICSLLPIPVSRQQLVADGRILKNGEILESLSVELREKKK